jgi:hypothetical protein
MASDSRHTTTRHRSLRPFVGWQTIARMEKAPKSHPSKLRMTFAPGIELTAMQREFVVQLVRTGTNVTNAARLAGYEVPQRAGYELSRTPHVQAAIQMERQRYISGELANVATGTLRHIMEDKKAPAAARVQAARTVMEMAGHLGKSSKTADDDKPLSEMDAQELAALIDRWTEERASIAKPLAPGDVQVLDEAAQRADVTPPSA